MPSKPPRPASCEAMQRTACARSQVDPAVAIGVAIRCRRHGPIPRNVIDTLLRQHAAGDVTSGLVAAWLTQKF